MYPPLHVEALYRTSYHKELQNWYTDTSLAFNTVDHDLSP